MLSDSISNRFQNENNLSCYICVDEKGDKVLTSKRPHSEVPVPMAEPKSPLTRIACGKQTNAGAPNICLCMSQIGEAGAYE